jgi:hypothetical protein
LARANLADADLAGAYLADADLAGADLARADLADANLAGAKNFPDLSDHKDPAEPFERKSGTRVDHARRYRERHPEVPVVADLDTKMLQSIEAASMILDMANWHGSCGTTHCRAGGAIHLAGAVGYALETQIGSERAGRAIYLASTGRTPYFFASNEAALADIRRCAAEEQTEKIAEARPLAAKGGE